MSHNVQNVYRIEHKTHRNTYLSKAYPGTPINSGLYTYFSEYDPWKAPMQLVDNPDAVVTEEMKEIFEIICKLEKEFDSPKEKELRDRICKKGDAGVKIGAPAAWNFKRPNAYTDPFLRDTYVKMGLKKNLLPLYGFRDKQTMLDWFNGDTEFLKRVLASGQFDMVKYRCKTAFHGLRSSIFYPEPSDTRLVLLPAEEI